MKTTTNTIKTTTIIFAACFSILWSCSKQTEATKPAENTELALSSIWLDSAPENRISVEALRQRPIDNQEYAVEGVIGAVMHPFTEGFASFVLADDSILFCNEMEDDHCETPWDACCEDPDKIEKGRVFVQFLDPTGMPIAQSLQGARGLDMLSKVIVVGSIDPASGSNNMNFNATSIFIQN